MRDWVASAFQNRLLLIILFFLWHRRSNNEKFKYSFSLFFGFDDKESINSFLHVARGGDRSGL